MLTSFEVRYADLGGGKWTQIEVYAYEVIYETRSVENGTIREYLAMGDKMMLPTELNVDGYDFTGWYNTPDAANANGEAYTETQFTAGGTMILYGNWTAKTYQIEFVGMSGVTNMTEGDVRDVIYHEGYQLPIPEATDGMGKFMGWYTGPGGSGTALTDSNGTSITAYAFARNSVAYPFFNTGVLDYILQSDGTYAVTAGYAISSVTHVTIPEYYKGIPVTTVLENAFYNKESIEVLDIPATIRSIGVGAIPTTASVKEINVYTDVTQQNYEVFYSSHDGALLRHDMGSIYLEVFPRGKTGEYIIPDEVTIIRDNVFRYAQITKLTVGTGVTLIARRAFYSCSDLQVLEFKSGGSATLTIDSEAFYRTTNLTTLRLPARLAEMNLTLFNQFDKLVTLEVEPGGSVYSSMHNMICNAAGSAILYAPMGISGEFEIPAGIREIGPMAFVDHVGLTKVVVPAYVKTLDTAAFQGCTGITEVIIEGNRRNDLMIGENAFQNCTKIITIIFQGNGTDVVDAGAITIGTSAFEGASKLRNIIYEAGINVAIIGARAFANCVSLQEAYISATITEVGNGAFLGCEGVRDVTFAPNGKQVSFGLNVFDGCKRLTSIYLPSTLSTFDGSVFAGCHAINEIVIDADNPNFATYYGALYTKDYSEILFYPKDLDGNQPKLHPDLKRISANVFQGNSKITTVELSNKIEFIGDFAFDGCYNLTNITFLEGCSNLIIGKNAFSKCTLLTSIKLPAATTHIGDSAFERTPLTTFVIPVSVTYIGTNALKGTKISAINIPANVETIGDGAFVDCTDLVTVTFAQGGTKPLTIGTLSARSSNGVFCNTNIVEVILADRVTLIGAYAFYNLQSLTTLSMGVNSQVTEIGKYALAVSSGTSQLSNLTLGGNLKTIHPYAFARTGQSVITIPKSVTLVDQYAFYYAGVTEVIFEGGGTRPLTINPYAFSYCSKLTSVTLPARLENLYSSATYMMFVGMQTNDLYNRFYNDNALAAIHVEPGCNNFASMDGILYEMDDKGNPTILLYCPAGKTGEYVIPKEVRLVVNGAFVNTKLSKISFEEYPKSHSNYGQPLLEVGQGRSTGGGTPSNCAVFSGNNLVEINFPSHLKRLGVMTCYSMNALGTKINFNMDATLEDIGGVNFSNCDGITELHLPTVNGLGVASFNFLANVTEITLGANSNIAQIPNAAYSYCSALTTVYVPASVTSIGEKAFYECNALSNIIFENIDSITAIGKQAFKSTALTTFVLSNNVTTLQEGVFDACQNLKTVTLGKSLAAVNLTSGMFRNCLALENVFVADGNLAFQSVDGVLYDLTGTILYAYPAAKDPSTHKLLDSLITIEAYAFSNFRGKHIELPERLETIGRSAFFGADLDTIRIPKNVVSIADAAFYAPSPENGCLKDVIFAEDGKLAFIGANAFTGSAIKTAILPDSVTEIEGMAFSGSHELEVVILPAGLKTLNWYTFSGISKIKTFIMQEGLESIATEAVRQGMNYALTELTIPSTVINISSYAFQNFAALKTLTFAEGSQLTGIGIGAFYGSSSLERLVLPAKLQTFGSTNITWTNDDGISFKFISAPVFGNCTSLKYVDMSACVDMTLIPSELFQNCYSIETLLLPPNLTKICDLAFGTREEYVGLRSLKEIVIPASVTTIGGYAFNGCSSLETVIFAEGSPITELGVQELEANNFVSGANIFAGTTNLKTLVLPKNLTLIGISCFEGSGVTELKLPITVTTIGARAFRNCANIAKAELTANLVYLGDEAFSGCGKLEEANLYFGLEYLGAQAFAYSGLKNAYIPATVTSMSGNPFAGCMAIESITLDNDNIDFKLVDGVLYDSKIFTLIYYPANLTADTFHIPDTVHEIASGAFAGAQLKSLVIPYRITEIPDYAFQNSALETITLHRGIRYLGNYAFAGMEGLKQLFVSNVELQIESYTFADLAGDVDIYFYEHTKDEIVKMCGNDDWFTNASETANFYFKDTMPEGIVIPQ